MPPMPIAEQIARRHLVCPATHLPLLPEGELLRVAGADTTYPLIHGLPVMLADRGAAVTICARKEDAAHEIADLVGGKVGSFPPRAGTWDILINATPAGTGPEGVNPIAGTPLDGDMVFDPSLFSICGTIRPCIASSTSYG